MIPVNVSERYKKMRVEGIGAVNKGSMNFKNTYTHTNPMIAFIMGFFMILPSCYS